MKHRDVVGIERSRPAHEPVARPDHGRQGLAEQEAAKRLRNNPEARAIVSETERKLAGIELTLHMMKACRELVQCVHLSKTVGSLPSDDLLIVTWEAESAIAQILEHVQ